MKMRCLTQTVRVLVVVAGLVLAGTQVSAQQQVVGQAGPFAMPISNRSVELISTVLRLDPDQRALVKSLYAGYRASFRQAAESGDAELKASHDKYQEGNGQDFAARMRDDIRITKAFVEKITQLEKSFMTDVKAVLTEAQAAHFERAERARRREVGFKLSFISGEGVDVFQILQDMKIDRDSIPALKEELEPYEAEVDRTLAAKHSLLRKVFDQMEKFEGPEPDEALMEKTIGEFFDLGMKLRDLNRQLVRKITPMLPEERQAEFDRAVKVAGFPRVYAPSAAEKTIKAAQGLADLTADQKTELAAIAESHRREADAANGRWAQGIEERQAGLKGKFREAMMGGMGGAGDDPLKEPREARKAVDERAMARVAQLLRPEQKEKLPTIEKDKEWHGTEFMPDFDEREAWEEWKKEDGE